MLIFHDYIRWVYFAILFFINYLLFSQVVMAEPLVQKDTDSVVVQELLPTQINGMKVQNLDLGRTCTKLTMQTLDYGCISPSVCQFSTILSCIIALLSIYSTENLI